MTRSDAAQNLRPEIGAAMVAGAAVVVYLLTATYVLPWYSAWSLPVLALVWRSRLALIGAVQAAVAAMAYTAPIAVGGPLGGAFRVYARMLAPLIVLIALVVLVSSARRDRLAEPRHAGPGPGIYAPAGSTK